jgi:hypothetical protein
MRKALDQIERQNLRHRRAMMLTAAVLRIVDEHTRHLRDPEDRYMRNIHDAVMDAFMAEGVDVLTDHDRAQIGLAPRGPDGWTMEEIIAMDERRLAHMRTPMPAMILPAGTDLLPPIPGR